MRKFSIFSTLLPILILCCATSSAIAQEFRLPPAKKIKLANGLTVILVEQHETPLVDIAVLVRAGSTLDPKGKEGLAGTAAEMLTRGTRRRTSEKIAEEIDFVGGELEYEAEHDFSLGHAQFLSKDIALALDLVGDTLRNPTFPVIEMRKLVQQKIDGIKQEKDQAQAAILRYFDGYLFGDLPYGRPASGDERSLRRIMRLDVLQFYRKHYGPGATTIVVAGDFQTSGMERLIAEKLGDWRDLRTTKPEEGEHAEPTSGRRLLLVDKPDSTQTFFIIGNLGIARTNPDRVAIEIVNTVFGGRFTSMLNDALRVSSGLTYGAGSFFDERRLPGSFVISTFTGNQTTVEAMDMALEVLNKLHADGLSEEQLRSAKAYLKGQAPPEIETNEQLAKTFAELEYYGLDEREINDYFARLDAVTQADVERVIKRYFPSRNLVFVLIGKAAEIGDKVKKYAPRVDVRAIGAPGF